MGNETGTTGDTGLRFYDTLFTILIDCMSGNPARAINCRINTALGAVSSIILPIFLIGGFIGNGFTVYIYLRKLRPLTRQGVYYAMIAVSDSCNLFVTGFLWMFLAKGLPWISGGRFGFIILNASDLACRIMRFFELLFSMTSSTLFLLMIIDRCLSVYRPFKMQRAAGKSAFKACLIVIFVDVVASVLFTLPFQWIVTPISRYVYCGISVTGWQQSTYMFGFMMLFNPPTLPFLAILIANGFLIAKMRQIVAEQAELRAGRDDGGNKLTNTVICVALSIIQLTCSLPVEVFAVGSYIINTGQLLINDSFSQVALGFNDLGRIFIMLNQSVNWIVLLWKSAPYRSACVEMLSTFCPYSGRSLETSRTVPVERVAGSIRGNSTPQMEQQ